ncbi:MAG: glycosyltransferase family 2 protein [Anaerolineae bacterium]|nr:glycosyltransferase family 2 protein [Anaerolineae bacterium]
MTTLSIVIPAYNEENGIAQIIERVLPIGPSLSEVGVDALELLVVDDGSRDRTAEIAAGYPEVLLVRHIVNQGYGAALKTGFGHACGDLLGFLDADGTYPPEHFADLCRVALEENVDLVVGSRMSGAESEMPLVRRIGNLVFANLASLLGNHRVRDSASGMRVIRREALSRLYPLPDGLNFTPVMSIRALHEEIAWREVPIPYKERVGRSKLSVVRDGMRFLETILWTALTYNPVRILGGVGLGLAAVAALIAVAIVAVRLGGTTRLGPWWVAGVFVGSLCAFAGVTLFALGTTANYLVSLFHKNPIRQGLFGHPLFRRPLERHFGWMGVVVALVGLVIGIISLALGVGGWAVERLWFYLLGAAMCLILGLQLAVFGVMTRVLAELSQRELEIGRDLEGSPCELRAPATVVAQSAE